MLDAPLARVTESPAKRLSQYRQEYGALQEFVNRLLTPGFDPDFDQALANRAAAVLHGDPALAEAVLTAITPGRRGPTRHAATSPAAALVKRTYEMAKRTNQTRKRTNQSANGTYVSPGSIEAAPSPTTTPDSVDSVLSPTGTALSETNERNGRARNLHWDALTAAVGEARTAPAKNRRGKAVHDLKEAGYSPEDIAQAAANWKRTMGDVLMTDMSMVSHIGQALNGPMLGSQVVYETAQVKHGRGLR